MVFVTCPKPTEEEKVGVRCAGWTLCGPGMRRLAQGVGAQHSWNRRWAPGLASVVGTWTGFPVGLRSCCREAWRQRPTVPADVGGHSSAPASSLVTWREGPFRRPEK